MLSKSKHHKMICLSWAEIQSADTIKLESCKINCNKGSEKKESLNLKLHTILAPPTYIWSM